MDMHPILLSFLPTSVFFTNNKIFYLHHENFPEDSRNTTGKKYYLKYMLLKLCIIIYFFMCKCLLSTPRLDNVSTHKTSDTK